MAFERACALDEVPADQALAIPLGRDDRALARRRAALVGGRVDEDELRLLAGEANLDVAGGQLRRELHRDLREEVEQLQPQAR